MLKLPCVRYLCGPVVGREDIHYFLPISIIEKLSFLSKMNWEDFVEWRNLNLTLKNRQDFKIWTWLGDSMSGRENPSLVVWNNLIFFLFQVQVLKLLLNLSENPAMTDQLLDAQVSTCTFVLSIHQFGQTDSEGKDLSQSMNGNSPWGAILEVVFPSVLVLFAYMNYLNFL